MPVGTVLVGEAAVKAGLIDAVGTLSDGLKKLNELISIRRRIGTGSAEAVH